MSARREHLTPLVKGSHVPMVVDVVGLFDAQSTLSGSGIVLWCSVHYPPFDLEVNTALENKLACFIEFYTYTQKISEIKYIFI